MRVFDRYDGCEVDLPDEIVPGRFRLLRDTALTADVHLRAGQVVVGDTWSDFPIGGGGAVIRPIGQSGMTAGQFDLLELAVSTLAQSGQNERSSPLMPASVGELAKLGDLEHTLLECISHLREINQRPRMSMHYESEVASLSRVRKLAPSAITYLAAHSEDWHRRTLSGIAPKRILGLFSEDELAIYENKVYARLLEKLEIYLSRRRAQVDELAKQCREALEFGGAEDLDYRLRADLCSLWGDAFSDDETQRLLDVSEGALQKLDGLRRQVSVLRNGALYLGVPRDLQVPEQLRETNILQHDQHYRHLRTLWRLHQQRSFGKPMTAREAVERNLGILQDYIVYVGMLCRRALAEFKLLERGDGKYKFAGGEVKFSREGDEWYLDCGEDRLVIVPTLLHEDVLAGVQAGAGRRVLVSLLAAADDQSEELQECTPETRCFSANPRDFHGLEKIRMMIEAFLWREAFSQYGRPIGKLPAAAAAWLETRGLARSDTHHGVTMLKPVDPKDELAFSEWLKTAGLNSHTRASIRSCAENLRTLSSCRECGERGRFEAGSEGFLGRCTSCFAQWRLWTEHGKRVAELSMESSAARSFRTRGARLLRLTLS
jgi:hypothetical protein